MKIKKTEVKKLFTEGGETKASLTRVAKEILTVGVAVPYLALSIPIVPSLVIGTCAFVAGELVFKTDIVESIKETNYSLYQVLENAKKQNKHILEMIPLINNVVVTKNLNEIHDSVSKIIKTI